MKRIFYTLSCCALSSPAVFAQIGFGTASPNSNLDVRGGVAASLRTFTSSTTVAYTDHTVVYLGTTAATAGLPDATTCSGRIYWIKNASSTLPTPTLTVNTTSSQTIEGAATYALEEPNEIIRVVSDGANWLLSSQDAPGPKTTTTGGAWNQGGNTLKAIKSLGTISNYDLPFITNNLPAMGVSTAGFLGIGTNTPQYRLHAVNEDNDDGNNYLLYDYLNGASVTQGFLIKKAAGSYAAPANLQNGDTIAQIRFAPRFNGSITTAQSSGIDAIYKGDGITGLSDMRFFTSGLERMRLNENAKLSIGTTVPDGVNPEKLLVEAGTTGSYNVVSGKGDIDNYLQLNIQNTASSAAASSDIVASADNGDENVNFVDMGINSSAYNTATYPILNGVNLAYLYTTGADFVVGDGTSSQDLVMFTNGYTAANERLRISANGNTSIGAVSGASEKLVVAGVVTPSADNTYTLGTATSRWKEVWATNGVIQTSDATFKTHILPLDYGIKEVLQLKPVRYNWKSQPDGKKKVGLIAQETQQIIPEVVKGDPSKDTLGMNYAEMVAVLIHAIQDQQKKIKELRAELKSLTQN